ncbi:MAG: VOC family protein, partial [Longimicrobiales bacterium]
MAASNLHHPRLPPIDSYALKRGSEMLGDANVQPMLPVKDLKAAEKFYEDVLGLDEVDGEPGEAVVYQSGSSTLCVYRSAFAGTN